MHDIVHTCKKTIEDKMGKNCFSNTCLMYFECLKSRIWGTTQPLEV